MDEETLETGAPITWAERGCYHDGRIVGLLVERDDDKKQVVVDAKSVLWPAAPAAPTDAVMALVQEAKRAVTRFVMLKHGGLGVSGRAAANDLNEALDRLRTEAPELFQQAMGGGDDR